MTVFTGTRDEVIDSGSERFSRIVENLRATVVSLPGADHEGVIADSVAWPGAFEP